MIFHQAGFRPMVVAQYKDAIKASKDSELTDWANKTLPSLKAHRTEITMALKAESE